MINNTGIWKISIFIQEYGVELNNAVIEHDIINANRKLRIHLFKVCNSHPSLSLNVLLLHYNKNYINIK